MEMYISHEELIDFVTLHPDFQQFELERWGRQSHGYSLIRRLALLRSVAIEFLDHSANGVTKPM